MPSETTYTSLRENLATVLDPDPISAQLVPMKFGPVENQSEGPRGSLPSLSSSVSIPIFASRSRYIAWKCGGG